MARPEDPFALFLQCLRVLLEGLAALGNGRMLDLVVTCRDCGGHVEARVPVH